MQCASSRKAAFLLRELENWNGEVEFSDILLTNWNGTEAEPSELFWDWYISTQTGAVTCKTIGDHQVETKLLSREEAAKFLGVKPNTLACWASTKRYQLPMIKVGRVVRYRLADLERWLESRTEAVA